MSESEAEPVSEVCAGYRVFGRVQGVGFRWWTCTSAERLGVRGTVANRADGAVEVQACGTPDALTALEEDLWKGPWAARVERIERFEIVAAVPGDGFRVIG